ncbi:PAS domain S-box protein [Blastopirellula sp. JC733]|nr:PAS domain S-box protein [Blastopirellula sediminis]
MTTADPQTQFTPAAGFAQPPVISASDSQFSELLLSVPDAIVISDSAGRISLVNDQLCEIFQYAQDQLIGQSVEMLLPARYREGHVALRQAYMQNPLLRPMGQFREVLGLRSDGKEIPVEIRLRMFEGSNGMFVTSAVRDVSEIRMLHRIQADSNRMLELIASGESVEIVLSELEQCIKASSPDSCCAIVGWSESGGGIHNLLSSPETPGGESKTLGWWDVDHSRPLASAIKANQRTRLGEEAIEVIERFAFADSTKPFLDGWLEPIRNPHGSPLGAILVCRHKKRAPGEFEEEVVSAAAHLAGIVLERDLRAAEFTEKEEQLRQSQKLEAIGTLTGGIAHEFNNLLQVILGYSDCVMASFTPDDPRLDDMAKVVTATEDAVRLTGQLLTFGRRQKLEKSLVDLNQVARDVVAMLRPLVDANIEIIVNCDSSIPPILADVGQLRQVLFNLCLNAQDAIQDAGRIEIMTSARLATSPHDAPSGDAPSFLSVSIAVKDSGCGITKELKSKIFDPFFTTKEVGEGTGLGLAVVHGIVRDLNGTIEVESEPGEGATFLLTFPPA